MRHRDEVAVHVDFGRWPADGSLIALHLLQCRVEVARGDEVVRLVGIKAVEVVTLKALADLQGKEHRSLKLEPGHDWDLRPRIVRDAEFAARA